MNIAYEYYLKIIETDYFPYDFCKFGKYLIQLQFLIPSSPKGRKHQIRQIIFLYAKLSKSILFVDKKMVKEPVQPICDFSVFIS